jgi:GNAT superfamily N-acetyltransferase
MRVKKAFYRKGIGRKLFQSIEKAARESSSFIQAKTVDDVQSAAGC